jgi:hypothetical protein
MEWDQSIGWCLWNESERVSRGRSWCTILEPSGRRACPFEALTEIKNCQTGEISDLDWNGTSQLVDACGMSRNELVEDAHGAPDLNHQDEGHAHQALTEINTCQTGEISDLAWNRVYEIIAACGMSRKENSQDAFG